MCLLDIDCCNVDAVCQLNQCVVPTPCMQEREPCTVSEDCCGSDSAPGYYCNMQYLCQSEI
jgi:hypothetical protein